MNEAPNNAWLEVYRSRRHPQLFLRDARAERDTGSRDDSARIRMLLNELKHARYCRNDGVSRDHLESLAWMPEVWVSHRGAGFLDRSYRVEAEPAFFDQSLKIWIRENRRPMTTRLQRKRKADERMHITCTTDRWKKDIQGWDRSSLGRN
jgi:hypothetical protein